MAQEWLRGDSWTARNGQSFSSAEEYGYVEGPASLGKSFAGTRDEANVGMTPDDFVARMNGFIEKRAALKGIPLNDDTLLNREEVIGLRLYTGPAFQPLNNWLRNVGKLEAGLRERMAKSPAMTYAATTRHIVSGIRKLSRVGHPDVEDGALLWRGVGGVLPNSFWARDAAGIVCATDLGFMSTSMAEATPVHYMQPDGPNVLRRLDSGDEDAVGFHCGAVIADLSQYAGEKEVLFPPLTMLRVSARSDATAAAAPASVSEDQLAWEVHDLVSGDGKEYKQIEVTPSFI